MTFRALLQRWLPRWFNSPAVAAPQEEGAPTLVALDGGASASGGGVSSPPSGSVSPPIERSPEALPDTEDEPVDVIPDLGPCIAGYAPDILTISCGFCHTGGWRASPHKGWDLAIPSGAAQVVACLDGWVVLADEVDPAAVAAGDPRSFNAGAGRYCILVYPLPNGWYLVQRVLHLLDIEDRFSGGGENYTATPIKQGEVIGIIGGNAEEDIGAGYSFGSGHLHTDLKLVDDYTPSEPFSAVWSAWGQAYYEDPAKWLAPGMSQRWTLSYPVGWNL